MTRADAIKKAVDEYIESKRAIINAHHDLRTWTIFVELSPDCLDPREVRSNMQDERRKKPREPNAGSNIRP